MKTQPKQKHQRPKRFIVRVLQTRWPSAVVEAKDEKEAMLKAETIDSSEFTYAHSNDEWLIDSAEPLEPEES